MYRESSEARKAQTSATSAGQTEGHEQSQARAEKQNTNAVSSHYFTSENETKRSRESKWWSGYGENPDQLDVCN